LRDDIDHRDRGGRGAAAGLEGAGAGAAVALPMPSVFRILLKNPMALS
jgi:hypothetical protein